MQLLSMHVDTVRALQRLHIPFDDLTPDGLWGTPYHLIGVTGDQRDVLNAWGVAYDEVTPAIFQRTGLGAAPLPGSSNGSRGGGGGGGGAGGGARLDSRAEQRVDFRPEPRPEPRSEQRPETSTSAATPAAAPAPTPTVATAAPTATPAAAPTAASAAATAAKPAGAGATATATAPAADDQLSDGTRLRTSFRGRYREAIVRGGKILLDGRSFDSLTQASTSISADKNDWEFWEYFDAAAGKWRMLDREWQA